MSLFSRIKQQCLKVIEWSDNSQDTLVYKFPVPDRYAIMKNSQLTVRASQMAVFVMEGQIADVFAPGRYKLEDIKNVPILTKLMSWKYAWETPYTGEIYFVNTKQFVSQKWGTTNPVMMRDADFGMIRIRSYGTYAFRVVDPSKFLKELFGTSSIYTTQYITDQLKRIIISKLSDSIAESKIPALDLAANYTELSEITQRFVSPDFDQFGMEISSLYIENISLPPEVEKTMDTRTSMGVLGDLNKFTQYQSAQAIRDAAQNPGGTAGMGISVGAGVAMGKMMAEAMSNGNSSAADKSAAAAPATTAAAGIKCTACGADNAAGSAFCSKCGAKLNAPKFCPKCGTAAEAGDAFCKNCGTKL